MPGVLTEVAPAVEGVRAAETPSPVPAEPPSPPANP
jgi:hypothetical protein